jgi:hypothetical protein
LAFGSEVLTLTSSSSAASSSLLSISATTGSSERTVEGAGFDFTETAVAEDGSDEGEANDGGGSNNDIDDAALRFNSGVAGRALISSPAGCICIAGAADIVALEAVALAAVALATAKADVAAKPGAGSAKLVS